MTRLVDSSGKDLLAEFQHKEYSFEDELEFLERVAYTRINYLMAIIDSEFPTSAGVVTSRLEEPMELLKEIEHFRNRDSSLSESDESLERIKTKFFGQL